MKSVNDIAVTEPAVVELATKSPSA
jgi:hypothetical protein